MFSTVSSTGVDIERRQRAQIDHFRFDAFLRERRRRFQRAMHH